MHERIGAQVDRATRPAGGLIQTILLAVGGLAFVLVLFLLAPAGAGAAAHFPGSTYSSPIAMSAGGGLVWVVNPDVDTVSVIRTRDNKVVREIRVGDEPQGVALDPANRYAYVANAADSTVSVIRIKNANPARFSARIDKRVGHRGALTTGAEPWNIVSSPDGRRVFVSNSAQDTITVIDATRRTVRHRVHGKMRRRVTRPHILGDVDVRDSLCNDPDRERHFQPRGLAVTPDNRKLYVTAFFAFTKRGAKQSDDYGHVGVVCRLNINTKSRRMKGYRPAQRIELAAQRSGFEIDSNPDTFGPDPVPAYPNQMQSIVIRGSRAYLPNVAASPAGPQRRNGNTDSFVNMIIRVLGGHQSDGGAINLDYGGLELIPGAPTLFFGNAWGIAFTTQSGEGAGYGISAASDVLVKVLVSADGTLRFTTDENTTDYVDLNDPDNPATSGANAGKNPHGIVINRAGTRAYVANYVSRNVSVVDLTNDTVIKVIPTAALPKPGSRDEVIQVGREMFYSSRGVFDRGPRATDLTASTERLASQGFGSCASCHFKGLTDGVVWESWTGPRKSVPLNATFNPRNRHDQRIENYSATFDEVEDQEFYIRGRIGHGPGNLQTLEGSAIYRDCESPPPEQSDLDPAHGLLMSDTGDPDKAPCLLVPFTKPNEGRTQWTVTLPGSTTAVPALTALKQYVRYGIRTPNAPLTSKRVRGGLRPSTIRSGRRLFMQAGCNSCHVGGKWTISRKNFKSPPAAKRIFTETSPAPTFGSPPQVEYLNSYLRDIGSFNLGVRGKSNPLGHNIGAEELAAAPLNGPFVEPRPDALGIDYNGDGKGNGYNVPSLLGIYASPPYYHNGACETLQCVLSDVDHRTGKGKFRDRLKSRKKRAALATFLESIDRRTTPP
jgi:YVTN family beta-propeller protein